MSSDLFVSNIGFEYMKNWLCIITVAIGFFVPVVTGTEKIFEAAPVLKNTTKDTIIVSLGSHCEVANNFRKLGSRYFSTPVDWLLSLDHKGLTSLIARKFIAMFDEKFLYQYPEGYVVNTHYNIDFRHDWPDNDLYKHLPSIKEKYERRIERFFNLHEHSSKIFFVRSAFDNNLNVLNNMPFYTSSCRTVAASEAQELYDVLEQKFSHVKFVLVIINYEEEKSPPIVGLKNIIEFKVSKLCKDEGYRTFTPLLIDPAFFDQIYSSGVSK